MKITNADARALAGALNAGADKAEAAGQTDFDLISSVQEAASESLAELAAAIKNAGG